MAWLWQAGRFQIDLSSPQIMGIVNVTPDSFSDGGLYSQSVYSALVHAEKLLKEGADILDIGGESTRPGSGDVSIEEEWRRVQPILLEVVKWNIPISLDTRHAEIMRRALMCMPVDIINDVSALSDNGAVDVLAQQEKTGICLMHMKGLPGNMQHNPQYQSVTDEVADYLSKRLGVCVDAGIEKSRIMVDPGFGFGKTLQHNIELMQHLSCLIRQLDLPFLIGVSRKRMIGELVGESVAHERVYGSVAAALASVARGASVIRVHDVKATVDAVKVWQAMGIHI